MNKEQKTLLQTSILLLQCTLGSMSPREADNVVKAVIEILKTIE